MQKIAILNQAKGCKIVTSLSILYLFIKIGVTRTEKPFGQDMLLFVRQTEKLREMVNKLCVYVVPNLLLMLSNIADTVNKHKTTIAAFGITIYLELQIMFRSLKLTL